MSRVKENVLVCCEICQIERPFNEEFFRTRKSPKICRICASDIRAAISFQDKYGIKLEQDSLHSISIIQWYEYYLSSPNGIKMKVMPICLYTEENYIKIWRYLFSEKLNINLRENLLKISQQDIIDNEALFKNKDKTKGFYSVYDVLSLTFPEHSLKPWEFNMNKKQYVGDYDKTYEVIDWFMEGNNFSLEDILDNKVTRKMFIVAKLNNILKEFDTISDLLVFYVNRKYNLNINTGSFKIKSKKYLYDKQNADNELRKFVDYLLINNKLDINNVKEEIPNIFNQDILPSFGQYQLLTASLYHYKTTTFYQWFKDVYPEWELSEEDFNQFISIDGNKFDSRQEVEVYNYLKESFNLNIINTKRGKKFKIYNEKYKENYIPDFFIYEIDGIKLDKPLIVEYFGMYKRNLKNEIYINYSKKTERKIEFYNSIDSSYFLPIFPEDIKKRYEGIRLKFENFIFNYQNKKAS